MDAVQIVVHQEQSRAYSNNPDAIYGYCDVLAIAEILYSLMVPTAHGFKLIRVSLADLGDVVEAVLCDEARQTAAFRCAFLHEDGSAYTSPSATNERLEMVAYACEHMVETGWLESFERYQIFSHNFHGDMEREKYVLVRPTTDLFRLMQSRFNNGS